MTDQKIEASNDSDIDAMESTSYRPSCAGEMLAAVSTVALVFSLALAGCSELMSIAFCNHSNEPIQICNLHLHTNACQTILPQEIGQVVLRADDPVSAWRFRITSASVAHTYSFDLALWPPSSARHCKVASGRRCMAVQLEPDGLLYWTDAPDSMPVAAVPNQPKGFPITPGS
jgi:hypothetical protein